MQVSIFEVAGPVMIGPSSSHTAGAARLARIARQIAGGKVNKASFGLHGSFAETYKGHGTDKALVAGMLGFREDDERLVDAFEEAKAANLSYSFHNVELGGFHENSVEISMETPNGPMSVSGSSVGGGEVSIRGINGFDVEFSALTPTLVIIQMDKLGVVSVVTSILSESGINIGNMRLSRKAKGDVAVCVIEVDSDVPANVADEIGKLDTVLSARVICNDSI